MAEFNAFTVNDETVEELTAAGFAPVLRWVRAFKSERAYKTAEALKYARDQKRRKATGTKRGKKS